MPMVRAAAAATVFLLFGPVTAAAQPAANACSETAFSAFDFWIGAWKVFRAADDAPVGRNTISRIAGGCALLEQWRSAGGDTGTSVNWYNPREERWRQLWVSSNGVEIDIAGGLDEDGRMVLEGTIETHGEHGPRPFRGIWTPRGDGSVRQRFDIRPERDAPWQLWFDGIYRRTEQAAE